MAGSGLDTYLNDHVAGAAAGVDIVQLAANEHRGGELGGFFAELATEIEEDRRTLERLVEDLAIDRSAAKALLAGIGAKLARPKFTGSATGDPDLGTFMALEALSLGVEGKLCMWRALAEVRAVYGVLAGYDLERLCERATEQRARIEEVRLRVASRALAEPVTA